MYDVVLGVDEDEERALAQAREVADLPCAAEEVRATLVHVFPGDGTGAPPMEEVSAVRRAKEHLEERGVEVVLEAAAGDATSAIIETADGIDADVICLAGRKRSPAGKVIFGSVTQATIMGTERSVLVCRAPSQ